MGVMKFFASGAYTPPPPGFKIPDEKAVVSTLHPLTQEWVQHEPGCFVRYGAQARCSCGADQQAEEAWRVAEGQRLSGAVLHGGVLKGPPLYRSTP